MKVYKCAGCGKRMRPSDPGYVIGGKDYCLKCGKERLAK